MKYTNNQKLPQIIVDAIIGKDKEYNEGKTFDNKTYSATEIIKPIRAAILSRRHSDEIVVDVSDRVWSLFGSAVHTIVERQEGGNNLTEERFEEEVIDGLSISGQIDIYEDQVLSDVKATSVWSIIYDSRTVDWELQLNIYRFLLEKQGFKVKKLQIIAFLRDWSKSKAINDSSFPQSNVVVVPIKILPDNVIVPYVGGRLIAFRDLENTPDADLPLCSPEDRWASKTIYAVMKEGRASAVKLYEDQEAAQMHVDGANDAKNLFYLEIRKGEDKRCKDYCDCNKFCSYYKEVYGND